MSEFKEVMKQRERMHETVKSCFSCPISSNNNGRNIECKEFLYKYPEEAEALIMKWVEEHPIMTNADKFKEVYGYTPRMCCLRPINQHCEPCEVCGELDCVSKWWNQEYKEPKEVE